MIRSFEVAERTMQFDGAGEGFRLRRALLLYAGVLILLFCDILFLGRTLDPYPFAPGAEGLPRLEKSGPCFCNDAGAVVWAFQPWNRLIHREIFEEGEVPLWNPYQATGVPLAANFQSGVFSPLQWPFFLSTSVRWWDVLFVLRLLVAAAFTFLFLRRIGLDFVSSWFGGLAYMLCGYFIDYINMNHIAIPLMLPAAFYFGESRRLGRRPAHFVGVVLSLTLLVLGGMPESTLLAGLLFGSFLVYRLASERRPFRDWLSWGWVLLLVVFLSAILLAPAMEYFGLSHSKHFTMDWGTAGFRPEAIVTFLVPFFFGAPGINGWHVGIDKAFNVPSGLGVATLVLAVTGLLWSRHRLRWFFGLYALLAMVKLFGPAFVQSVGQLPLLRWMIFTKYLQPSVAFCTAVLAAMGLEAVRGRSNRAGSAMMFGGMVAAMGIAGWLYYFLDPILGAPQRLVALSVLLCTGFGLAMGLSIACLGWAVRKGYRHGAAAVFLLASIEIVALGVRIHPVRRPSAPPAGFVERLRHDAREFRSIGDYPLFPNTASAAGVPDLRVLDPILPGRLAEGLSVLIGDQVQSRLTFREFDDYEAPALDLLGVRYVVSGLDVRNLLLRQRPQVKPEALWVEDRTGQDIALVELGAGSHAVFRLPSRCGSLSLLVRGQEPAALRLIGPDGPLGSWSVASGFTTLGPISTDSLPPRSSLRLEADPRCPVFAAITARAAGEAPGLEPVGRVEGQVRLFERPGALPVAFLTDSEELLRDPASAEHILGFGPRVVENDPAPGPSLTGAARIDAANRVSLVRLTGNRVEFDVQADRPGHLFISKTYYPGWSAEVNGTAVPIERAAYFMSALPMPAGTNRVVMHYRPGPLILGAVLTLIGLILTLISAKFLSPSKPGP